MHLTGGADRPPTGAFAERFMSSASSVLPTADCFIYYLLAASRLQLLAVLRCFSTNGATSISFRRAARLLSLCITSMKLADRCIRVFTYNPQPGGDPAACFMLAR
ncbi:hypothetical protein [Paraburkholderia sediminicola]|uniref:hypothetical protein n=1 Tax=Paraburkholderia sediminicola TaxID=458836 RepID=UPI0038B7978F